MEGFRHNLVGHFIARWLVSALGLWIAAGIMGGRVGYGGNGWVIVIAGLILAAINALIKPVLVLLSLPAVLLSLGLFMLVINGFIVWLVSEIYPSFYVSGFGVAILTGIIVGLVNYLVSAVLELK